MNVVAKTHYLQRSRGGTAVHVATKRGLKKAIAQVVRDLGANVELAKVPDWPGEFAPIGLPREHESDIWPL